MIDSGFAPFLVSGGDGMEGETLARNLMQWIADDHWSVDNPNPNATYPRLGTTKSDVSNNTQASSYWVRNGNFLRFKNTGSRISFSDVPRIFQRRQSGCI